MRFLVRLFFFSAVGLALAFYSSFLIHHNLVGQALIAILTSIPLLFVGILLGQCSKLGDFLLLCIIAISGFGASAAWSVSIHRLLLERAICIAFTSVVVVGFVTLMLICWYRPEWIKVIQRGMLNDFLGAKNDATEE